MNKGTVDDPNNFSSDEPLAIVSGADSQSLHIVMEKDVSLLQLVCKGYCEDPIFMKILSNPRAHSRFGICD